MNLGKELYEMTNRERVPASVKLTIFDRLLIRLKTAVFINECKLAAKHYRFSVSSATYKSLTPRDRAIVREIEKNMRDNGIYISRQNYFSTTRLIATWTMEKPDFSMVKSEFYKAVS